MLGSDLLILLGLVDYAFGPGFNFHSTRDYVFLFTYKTVLLLVLDIWSGQIGPVLFFNIYPPPPINQMVALLVHSGWSVYFGKTGFSHDAALLLKCLAAI